MAKKKLGKGPRLSKRFGRPQPRTGPPEDRLLDTDVIARAERLGLHARKIVEGAMAGNYRSPFTGFAIEFAQHREYSPGDDLRHLDWKVYSRKDRYYIKQYEQDTNLDATLLLDGSKSMQYTSERMTKMEYGRLIAACLAYLILDENNSYALNLFDNTLHPAYPRTTNRRALTDICRTLVEFQPQTDTAIGKVLREMAGRLKRRGIVIIISDLFDEPDTVVKAIQGLCLARQEVIVFHILDPYEIEFPFDGTVEFEGLEEDEKILVQPWNIKASYLEEFGKFLATVKTGCERNDVNYIRVNTAKQPEEVLTSYLMSRLRTTGH